MPAVGLEGTHVYENRMERRFASSAPPSHTISNTNVFYQSKQGLSS